MTNPKSESNSSNFQNQAKIENKKSTKIPTIRDTTASSRRSAHTYQFLLKKNKEELVQLEKDQVKSKKEIETQKNSLQQKNKKVKKLQDSTTNITANVKQTEKINNLAHEKDKAEKNHTEVTENSQIQPEKKLIDSRASHEKEIGDKNSEIQVYKNAIDNHKKEIIQLKQAQVEFEKKLNAKDERITQLNEAKVQTEKELKKSQDDLKKFIAHCHEINNNLVEERSGNKLLQEKINNLASKKDKEESEKKLNAKDERITQLNEDKVQAENFEADIEEGEFIDDDYSDQESLLGNSVSKEKEEPYSDNSTLTARTEYDQGIISLKLQINDKNTELERVQNDLKEQKIKQDEEINNLLVKEKQLEEESLQAIKIIQDLKEKNNFLIKAAEEENAELLKDLEDKSKIIQKLENDIRDKQAKLSWKDNDLEKQNHETLIKEKFLQQEEAQLQNELEEAKNNVQYTIQKRSLILPPLFFVIAGAVVGAFTGILALHFLAPLILGAGIGIGIQIGSGIIGAVAGGGGIGYLTNIAIDRCYNINVQVA